MLKPRLKDAKLDKRAMKEILVRLIYVEMLGHDASWGHVKALQACSNQSLQTKKVGSCSASDCFKNPYVSAERDVLATQEDTFVEASMHLET